MSDNTNETPNTETPDSKPQASSPDSEQGQQTAQDTPEATFTQADLDRIVGERLKREREAQEKKLKERFQVEDLSEVDKRLEAQRKQREAEMSEVEKLQADMEKIRKEAEAARQAKADLENRILKNQRKSAFVEAVRNGGGSNPERVYALLQVESPDSFEAVFGEDAEPDDKKMASLIKQVQSDYPEYFGNPGAGSPSNSNGVAPTSQAIATDELKKQMKKKFGKI